MPEEPNPYLAVRINPSATSDEAPVSSPSFTQFLKTMLTWYGSVFVVCLIWVNLDPYWLDNGSPELIPFLWRIPFAGWVAMPFSFVSTPLFFVILGIRDYIRSRRPISPR